MPVTAVPPHAAAAVTLLGVSRLRTAGGIISAMSLEGRRGRTAEEKGVREKRARGSAAKRQAAVSNSRARCRPPSGRHSAPGVGRPLSLTHAQGGCVTCLACRLTPDGPKAPAHTERGASPLALPSRARAALFFFSSFYFSFMPPALDDPAAPDLLGLGTRCATCATADFLPWKCPGCDRAFCADHRGPAAHACPTPPAAGGRVCLPCPVCARGVELPAGVGLKDEAGVSAVVDSHMRSAVRACVSGRSPLAGGREKKRKRANLRARRPGVPSSHLPSLFLFPFIQQACDPSNYARVHAKPRCPAPGCRTALTLVNGYDCRGCGARVCLTHRHGPDHACRGGGVGAATAGAPPVKRPGLAAAFRSFREVCRRFRETSLTRRETCRRSREFSPAFGAGFRSMRKDSRR